MRTLGKIAILTALIAFISSCQKEKLPTPGNSQQPLYSSDRHAHSSSSLKHEGEETNDGNAIVGGGDDDRDGGKSTQRRVNNSGHGANAASSIHRDGKDDSNSDPDEIVGGGDDDRDGGSGGPSTGKKGG